MIAIVDYGAGNLVSVKKAFDFLGQQCVIACAASQVKSAEKIVLPGVGNFASTDSLASSGLKDEIVKAICHGVPFLGICVGMQWMFAGSEEAPGSLGLAVLEGKCERFPASVKSPHVGWNSVQVKESSRLFRDIAPSSYFYFTHSFRAPVCDATVACCEYGGTFSAAVERDHLCGVQFHPEKSGESGLKLLSNFCDL